VSQDLLEGTVLAGRYVIDARLGDGAMGVVYRAHHVKVGRAFAIKILHQSLTDNPKVLRRFEREAELAGRLGHTNVAAVVDVGVTDDGVHFMVMELAPGTPLDRLLADGPMSETRVLDFAKQLCSGLAHAHEHGLLHRDFKPENVIVEQLPGGREVARIVDWGVAILREDATDVDSDDDGRLTTKGIVVGTPHYMAPEQARGEALDHRVDLFALGLICYELLTGLLPFDGSGVDVARANLMLPIPPMAERASDVVVDPVLEAVISSLLEKERDARPPSANAARELFELYERDRAACAVRLGIDADLAIPIEAAMPALVPASPPPAPPPERIAPDRIDPERDRDTLEVRAPGRSRRGLGVAIAMTCLLALVLFLGLRGDRTSRAREVAATTDALAPVALAVAPAAIADDTAADGLPEDIATPEPPALVAIAAPAKKLARVSSGSAAARTAPPTTAAPTAAEVATLYSALGRELKALEDAHGMDSTIELWPRYRWIRINDWLATPERRTEVAQLLERLRADARAGH